MNIGMLQSRRRPHKIFDGVLERGRLLHSASLVKNSFQYLKCLNEISDLNDIFE